MNVVEELHSLLFQDLRLKSPVLSGNMQQHIDSPNNREIIISAPFYNMKEWKKTGNIIHTGEIKFGRTDYAEWVNRLGGFATGNKSQGWVDRSIKEVVEIIANKIGATVIYEL